MTGRMRRFAEYFIACGNKTEAARKAGYSESYAEHRADELWRNVEVQAYLKELQEKAQDARILNAKERQAMLSDIARDTLNAAPADRIRAIDTLNKMTGEYTVRVEAEVQSSEKFADILSQLGGEGLEE